MVEMPVQMDMVARIGDFYSQPTFIVEQPLAPFGKFKIDGLCDVSINPRHFVVFQFGKHVFAPSHELVIDTTIYGFTVCLLVRSFSCSNKETVWSEGKLTLFQVHGVDVEFVELISPDYTVHTYIARQYKWSK